MERLLNYFLPHLGRIDEGGRDWRPARRSAVASVEGAAKTLGLRLKTRGARWRHRNARAMAAPIRRRQTDQWDLFWKSSRMKPKLGWGGAVWIGPRDSASGGQG